MNNLIWLLQQLSLQNLHGEGFLGFFSQKYECICDHQILQEPHSLGSSLVRQRLMRFIRGEDVSEFSFHV